MKSRPFPRKTPYLRVMILVIILTVIAGWLLTDFLGKVAEKDFKLDSSLKASRRASLLKDNLEDVTNAAKSLGPADAIVAALSSGSPADLDRANRLLDRIKDSFEMTTCYLLDRNGLTVASTDRNEKNSFVGQSFARRPYFTGAREGRLTTYFALGKVSRERGYFAAVPVVDHKGTITGVVVIKRNIAPVEEFFKNDPHVYLVSPEGIIFISSREEHLYRSLWPVTEKQRRELLASGQFGNITFTPLLDTEPRTGTYVRLDNENHYVQRLPFGSEGWTLVMIEHPRIVASYRLFGIILTAAFTLLLLLFFKILLDKNKSLETARDLLKARDDWGRTFDTVPDLIAIIDTRHRIVSMNRAMAERLGISRQEAVGRRCCELLHGTQEVPPSCPHLKMLASGKTESETRFEKTLNGDFIVTASPILAEDGTIESSVYVMHEISELKRLERSLKEYAQRLEYVLEGSNDASWEWDLITNQGILNRRYYEMTGYSPGEVNIDFEFFLSTIHPEDVADVQRRVQDNLDGKSNEYEAHYRMVTKSGKTKNVMGRGKVVGFDEDGRPLKMAGVITDITAMKRLSEEVNRISNLESIGLLAGGLAHDFNNVLNIIYGNITFAKMLANGNSAVIAPLTDAEEGCERARELGQRLQVFSLGIAPVKEPVALPAIMEDVAGNLFQGAHISYKLVAPDDLFAVTADPRQLRQVFENILANAKEAMADNGTVTVNLENYVVDKKNMLPIVPGDYVRIAFQDSGKGILAENLPKIFDPYFSTKDTYSQKGLGLGLSICHAILKRHNGHISVESTVGTGTIVKVYLPAAPLNSD